ncbi:anaerobic ribonucleoside-triphosphate reductase [Rhodoferax sp.]|uniref:anaerobic ribonucleoside-triphosphate reductase n=1 Tax=Rhodoferax sp. TaxID=50421 RepID=UPI00274A7BF1|nr:anaerobic ribonucleoside-triphosphate reductase [Rhodoferax sp.]
MSEQQDISAQAQTIVLRDDERQRCEVWTRVMGYHRPMASFNTGKKGEFHERTYFTERSCQVSLAA